MAPAPSSGGTVVIRRAMIRRRSIGRRTDLSAPREQGRVGISYDSEVFGEFAEAIARFIGTARFLVFQSVLIVVWISINVFIPPLRFDPYPFILLTLALSLQAAYAAPLILLAQGRQEARDRQQSEIDRDVAGRTQADAEFLAREIASVRLSLADMVTGDDVAEHFDRVVNVVEQLTRRIDGLDLATEPGAS
jgi:uncharacterized membrane protein